jgi:dephospho-CoA kinase
MILLGLTGSIGMGKSATLGMFADMGAATWDADAAVHALYRPGGAAVAGVEAIFPGVTGPQGVDRDRLSRRLAADPQAIARLEALVHPLVRADRETFLAKAEAEGVAVAVVDIPLLFETGSQDEFDAVVVVSAPADVQRTRVLARPGMTPERLDFILSRQMPDADKRQRADFIIQTDAGLEVARARVREIVDIVTTPGWTRPRDLSPASKTPQ